MAPPDTDRLLAMLRDPHSESRELAEAAGVPREEAARAARLALGIATAPAAEIGSLPAPLAAALARAAAGAGRADVLAALSAHPGKEVAKEARRGLHLLRSRGVAVPEPARPAPPPPAPAAPEPPLPCYATAIDGNGERALWVPRNVPGKGVEIAQVVVSDERGLVELQVGMLGRKEWRALTRSLLERGAPMGTGEIDRGRARAILADARARNDRSEQRVPEGADLWLAQLGPAAPLPDPAAAFPPLADDEEREAVAGSGKLHDLPLLSGWLADEEFLRPLAVHLDEIGVSPLYLDEQQRLEQMTRTVAEAVDAYFDERRRATISRRLFAVAEHLSQRGDPAHARLAAATARALARGAPAAQIPFARMLVEKAFPPPPPPPDARPPAEPQTGLIVPP